MPYDTEYKLAMQAHSLRCAIRDTRIILEAGAMAGVVAHIDEATIDRLAELAAAFSTATVSGTRIEQSEINSAFHHLIYAHCGNPVLEETIWALRDRSRGADGAVHLGFGLHVVKLVAAAHGGGAEADNLEDGSGVVFRLRLPWRRAPGGEGSRS